MIEKERAALLANMKVTLEGNDEIFWPHDSCRQLNDKGITICIGRLNLISKVRQFKV